MTTVTIEPESKLAEALRNAARTGDVLIVRAGDLSYTMKNIERGSAGEEPVSRPKPEEVQAVREALATAAGGWTGVDIDEFKEYIRHRRKTGDRPSVEL